MRNKKRARRDTQMLENRRFRGVQMIKDGKKQLDIAKELGVSEAAVSQWKAKYSKKGWRGLRATKALGQKVEFLSVHRRALKKIITKSPLKYGFLTPLWTTKMAQSVLNEQMKTNFSETTILRGLHSLGFHFKSR